MLCRFMHTEKQLQFNRYRNERKKTITHAKRSHYQDLFRQFKFDMKKTWTALSEILNRNNRNSVPHIKTALSVVISKLWPNASIHFLLQLENLILRNN